MKKQLYFEGIFFEKSRLTDKNIIALNLYRVNRTLYFFRDVFLSFRGRFLLRAQIYDIG